MPDLERIERIERIEQEIRKGAAGCEPTCRVLMSKLLIRRRLYGSSDARLEYPIRDRFSDTREWGRDWSKSGGERPRFLSVEHCGATRARPCPIRPVAATPNNGFMEALYKNTARWRPSQKPLRRASERRAPSRRRAWDAASCV